MCFPLTLTSPYSIPSSSFGSALQLAVFLSLFLSLSPFSLVCFTYTHACFPLSTCTGATQTERESTTSISTNMSAASSSKTTAQDELECVLSIPFPTTATANMALQVLKSEPIISGVTERRIHLASSDATRCTVEVLVRAREVRALRSTVGAVLEQEKLVVRTARAFTP